MSARVRNPLRVAGAWLAQLSGRLGRPVKRRSKLPPIAYADLRDLPGTRLMAILEKPSAPLNNRARTHVA